jgi:hypothetical protein
MDQGVTRSKQPTIWEALAIKLGREPTHAEACADVRRILDDNLIVLGIT